jgi:hypothetical protein
MSYYAPTKACISPKRRQGVNNFYVLDTVLGVMVKLAPFGTPYADFLMR